MPRSARVDIGGEVYHVINRANGRAEIFSEPSHYKLFENLLLETKELVDMRIVGYILMPNHWHLILHPKNDGDLGTFMHRLSNAHTRKVHAATNTNGSGHLYQGRYKSFLVDTDTYLLTLIKYVERNPVRAHLVKNCEEWQWGSAWRRINRTKEQAKLLDPGPTPFPRGYREWINTPDKEDDLLTICNSIKRGAPYGNPTWVEKMVTDYNLGSTMNPEGRPRKRR